MKMFQPKPRATEGSALLVALILTAIMGVTLASYLIMTESQNVSVVRSQTWNAAIALTEAGLEDGLALINKNNASPDTLYNWTNNLAADGYAVGANGLISTKRYVETNSWGVNSYEVFINNSVPTSPTISAIGNVNWKYSYASAAPQSYYAAVGDANSPSTNKTTTSRQISIQTKVDPMFAIAMAALQTIDLKGNKITTDSYDSSNPLYSTNGGQYPMGKPSMIRSNGDVATTSSLIDSIGVGNGNIKGSAKTGPGGTVSIGPNGYVTGGVSDDFNVQFPNVATPSAPGGWSSVSGSKTVDGTTYLASINSSGYYWLGATEFSKNLYINTNVTAVIYCTANVKLTGNSDSITMGPGSKVKFYMAGATFAIKGQGIVNPSGKPENFFYFGLPSNTSIDFGGNGGFTGSIYAPQAAFTLGGGGTDELDFIGASVTRNVTMNGKFNFHYDENLRVKGPGRGFVPTDWNE